MNEHFFTGIDMGSERIKIFTLPSGSEKFTRTSEVSTGMLSGYIQNKDEAHKSLDKAIAMAENRIKRPIERAIFGINSLGINSRILQTSRILSRSQSEITEKVLDDMEKNLAGKIVKPPFHSLLLMPIEYDLDGYKSYLSPIGSIASKISIKYLQVLVPANHIKMIEHMALMSNVDIIDIYPTILAEASTLTKNTEKNSGTIYVDFGHSITSYVFMKNGQPTKIKTIAFGSDRLSEVIALKLKVSKKDAEDFKKRPPLDSKKREIIARIISQYIKSIYIEIDRDIEKVNSQKDYFTSGMILSGGGSHLKDIEFIFEKIFKMPVRKITDPNLESSKTSFSGAYSLVVENKKNYKNRRDLIQKNVGGFFGKIKDFFG